MCYNQFVDKYCTHHKLEVIKGVKQNFIVKGDLIVAEFESSDNSITFLNSDGSTKTVMRKGDLLMCVIEDLKLH